MGKKKVLVADDERDYRELIKLVLEPEGFDVMLTDNGKDALDVLPNYNPDIVILDVNMPFIDGFEVCNMIRKDPNFSSLPVIFLTVRKNDPEKIRGIEIEGADDYITKPFKPRELVARINTVLKRTMQGTKNR